MEQKIPLQSSFLKISIEQYLICPFCGKLKKIWPFDFVISEKSQSELIFTFAICLIWDTNHGFLGSLSLFS